MEKLQQQVEKSSRLPRPTSLQSEHQVWKSWLGKQVVVSGIKNGTLLFYGKTQFADGLFCGVALDDPEGRHDGCVDGIRYFSCKPNHGVFAPVTKVQRLDTSSTRMPSLLPSPISAIQKPSSTFSPFFQEPKFLGRTGGRKDQQIVDYGSVQNVTFSVDGKCDADTTFVLEVADRLDATFDVDESSESPTNKTFGVEAGGGQMMFDIVEDDCEESSLGILTASQMIDLSQENLENLCRCDIPKTQSCDDVTELPEDEVVENITVEYPGSKELNLTFNVSTVSEDGIQTSTPVSSAVDCGPSKTADDLEAIKRVLEPKREVAVPIYEDVSLLEMQVLSCSFDDVTVDTCNTNSLAAMEKMTPDGCVTKESPSQLSETVLCNDRTEACNVTEELDLLNETLKNKLASGELPDLDRVGRVSIETVMEVIQRQEMYRNRPASTYTVGSTDTGYQGDGECDGRSETAGSPCGEEVKPLSLCSQEETTDTDRMMKSGHMSDSDFFTDQGASSEMELDGEVMKQSIASIQSEDAVCEGKVEEPAPVPSVADNSSSGEGDRTVVEDVRLDGADFTERRDSPSIGIFNVKKDVARTKRDPRTTAARINRSSLQPETFVKKVVRSPRKGNKWDAVTSKIAAGLAEEKKTKERREVRSRVDTNLSVARQCKRKNNSIDSTITETVSTQQGDVSRGSIEEARPRVPSGAYRPVSPASFSESFSASVSSCSSSRAPKTRIAQTKIAVPKWNLREGNLSTKGNVEKSEETKVARTSKSCASRQSQAPQSKVYTAAPPARKTIGRGSGESATACRVNATLTASTLKPNASSKILECAQNRAAVKQTSSRTPASGSRYSHSKSESEVRRLGDLCEQRTKELNMVKMQLKHACCGFDAFAVMVGYLAGELDAFSHPKLLADMQRTRERLAASRMLLDQYELELETLRRQHEEEVRRLTGDLDAAENEVASLGVRLEETETNWRLQVEEVRLSCVDEMREADERCRHRIEDLRSEHGKFTGEMEVAFGAAQEESKRIHEAAVAELLTQLQEAREKLHVLEQRSRQFEKSLQRDTDSKIRWMYSKNAKLVAEVDSLKSVMEMKQTEIRSLRKENLELHKELEELPTAQKELEKLRARNEDLQAVVREKSVSERKLSHEAIQMRDMCDKVNKDNRRISMENEELHWKLQQSLDGSWTTFGGREADEAGVLLDTWVSKHESSRKDTVTESSPAQMSPLRETDEDRPLATSPIDFYTLCAGSQSTVSSPARSRGRIVAPGNRQRHRSLGPQEEELDCNPSRNLVGRSRSLHESELYLKARLQYESDLLFQGSGNFPREENGIVSDGDSPESSPESHDSEDVGGAVPFDPHLPRSLAGEAMVSDRESHFDCGCKTPRTPEHGSSTPRVRSESDNSSCDSE